MASIRKHRKVWQLRWVQPDGTEASRTGFQTKAAALATKREIEDTVAAGRLWEPRDSRARVSLEEIGKSYIIDCSRTLKPSTVRGYARAVDTFLDWLAERESSLSPRLLNRPTLLEYFDHLSTSPAKAGRAELERGRKPVTSIKRIEELSWWWAWAHDNDERWPGCVESPRGFRFQRPPQARVVAPTWPEMDACIAAATGAQRKAAIIMRFTGLRIGQVMGLLWSDLDFQAQTLTVRPELGKSRGESVGRTVPASAHLFAELAGWGVREGWVIPTHRKAEGPRARVFRARDMARAWQRAGVRPEVYVGRPDHAFRKGFRSGLKREGADKEAIEYLIGHIIGEGEEGTYTDPDALPLLETIRKVPPLAIPAGPEAGSSMDHRWTKTAGKAKDPADKARLKAVPRK